MKIYAVTFLPIMISSAVIAQNMPPADVDKCTALPIPDSQVTNLFHRGYQTMGGEVSIIRIASRDSPERQYYAKIGDYVGSYRIDRAEGTGKEFVVVLVGSNETVEVRAHTPTKADNK